MDGMIIWSDEKHGSVEASCIGLKPGQWPPFITVDEAVWSFNEFEYCHGELASAKYTNDIRTLTVFND